MSVSPSSSCRKGSGQTSAESTRATAHSPVRGIVLELTRRLVAHEDELRELDAAIGDGDLGITVSAGARAVNARVRQLPDRTAPSALLHEAGVAFASANPSTFAALLGGGLVTAAANVDDSAPVDRAAGVAIGRDIAAAIAHKGGAQLGDKTILDVLVPALDRIEADEVAPAELRLFLWIQVDNVAAMRSRRGRAAWHQERSVGAKDPGSVAIAHALAIVVAILSPS